MINDNMTRRRFLGTTLVGAATLSLGGVLAACGAQGTTTPSEGSLDAIKRRGFALYGFDGEKPYNYTDANGNLVGAEIDVARYVFKQLGVAEVQGVAMSFDSFIPALQAGRIDTCLPIYVKPARCPVVNFSTPDLQVGEGAVVKAGNPLGIHSWDDVKKNSKIRIGLTTGATSNDIAKQFGIGANQITNIGDYIGVEELFKANRIDVFIDDNIITGFIAHDLAPEFGIVADFKQPVVNGTVAIFYAAFPFAKNQAGLRDSFDGVLKEILSNGTLTSIRSKYGYNAADAPGPNAPTLAQLCKG
jgi:polar amino acid transport system substrate-binding protein